MKPTTVMPFRTTSLIEGSQVFAVLILARARARKRVQSHAGHGRRKLSERTLDKPADFRDADWILVIFTPQLPPSAPPSVAVCCAHPIVPALL